MWACAFPAPSLPLLARDSSVFYARTVLSKLSRNRRTSGTVDRVTGHQLGVGKTLVDVSLMMFDLVQDQVAFNQNRNLAIRDSSLMSSGLL